MQITGYDTYDCPVSKTLALVSGKWKPVILYLVGHNVNRFGLLQKKMPRISKKILAEQLRELEAHGLISREVLISKPPQEVVYSLTEKGVSLAELTARIFEWGMTHMLDESSQKTARCMMLDY